MVEFPDSREEMRAAAERLFEAAAPAGQKSASYDDAVKNAWALVRSGDTLSGRSGLTTLAESGSRAAERLLASLDQHGTSAFEFEEELQSALQTMRGDDVVEGWGQLSQLVDQNYAPAAHFMAWLNRYRAEIALEEAAAL